MSVELDRFGFVLATKMLVDGRKKVRYMYHEPGDDPQDSGWRFFCGEEDDSYVNNPENIAVYHIQTNLELDPDILPYLGAPVNTALERDDMTSEFRASGLKFSQ